MREANNIDSNNIQLLNLNNRNNHLVQTKKKIFGLAIFHLDSNSSFSQLKLLSPFLPKMFCSFFTGKYGSAQTYKF